MAIKDEQRRVLLEEMARLGSIDMAAEAARMTPETARKILRDAALYGSRSPIRGKHSPLVREAEMFETWRANPLMTAEALIQVFAERYPDSIGPPQLSTVRRRMQHWREVYGICLTVPEREAQRARREKVRRPPKNGACHVERPAPPQLPGEIDAAVNAIWEERTRLRIPIRALARRAGVRAATISDWERGVKIPQRSTIAAVRDALEAMKQAMQ